MDFENFFNQCMSVGGSHHHLSPKEMQSVANGTHEVLEKALDIDISNDEYEKTMGTTLTILKKFVKRVSSKHSDTKQEELEKISEQQLEFFFKKWCKKQKNEYNLKAKEIEMTHLLKNSIFRCNDSAPPDTKTNEIKDVKENLSMR